MSFVTTPSRVESQVRRPWPLLVREVNHHVKLKLSFVVMTREA